MCKMSCCVWHSLWPNASKRLGSLGVCRGAVLQQWREEDTNTRAKRTACNNMANDIPLLGGQHNVATTL